LRYPGGTIGNYWDWRAGWFQGGGPWPGQTDPRGNPIPQFDDSLDPFAVACSRAGAGAVLVVNMLTTGGRLATNADNAAMIQDQLAFLRAAAAAGVAVDRVELGNEFYLSGAQDGPNGKDYTKRFPTANAYAQQANPWITAVHNAFPHAKIAAVGADATGKNSARREGWNAAVLSALRGQTALTLHPYVVVKDGTASPQSLLSLPYQRVQSLAANELAQMSAHGVECWVTEFNLADRTPDQTFAGTWTHGLFMAAYTLLLAQRAVVTLVDVHNVLGAASSGVLFDSTTGFGATGPATELLSRSAMGTTYASVLAASAGATSGQSLAFSGGPTIGGGAPGLVGLELTGGARHQLVVVNLATSAVTLDVRSLLPGAVSWSRTTAASLTTQVTGPGAVSVTSGTATGLVACPAHAVVRIWQ
jgi:hypothetical protein